MVRPPLPHCSMRMETPVSEVPVVGRVYEKGGKERLVIRLLDMNGNTVPGPHFDYVIWAKPDKPKKEQKAWISTWLEWARGASIVD
jgi:hypothetical protein